MSFVGTTLNHFRAIKEWGDKNDAKISMSMRSFEIEVYLKNRYFSLFPQFIASNNDRLLYVSELVPAACGFAGWLPYKPIRWDLSTNKLMFKNFMNNAMLLTPRWSVNPGDCAFDYILKQSVGSFGYGITGPFTRDDPGTQQSVRSPEADAILFAEQFIKGKILKLWCWGDQPFHAHLHDFPTVVGNGESTVRQLVDRLLQRIGKTYDTYTEKDAVDTVLKFQGIDIATVPAENQKIWIDYRYGRFLSPESLPQDKDNAMISFSPEMMDQISKTINVIALELLQKIGAPVLYAMDGILDDDGKIWWLEINSNPVVAPTGYPYIFATLFGIPPMSAH